MSAMNGWASVGPGCVGDVVSAQEVPHRAVRCLG
jgi:hypothetical protein